MPYDPNRPAGSYKEGRGPGTIEKMGRKEIYGRMQDPKDRERMKDLDRLARRAAEGDEQALERLRVLAALPGYGDEYGKGYGAGTRDARNYARLLIQDLTGEDQDFVKPGDAYIGDTVGKVLQYAAPIGAALIPGVGLIGAGLIGAAGSAVGQYGQYGKINLGKTLLSGGMAAGGNYLLGNGLGSGNSGLFGASNPAAGTALAGVPGGTTAATGAGGLGGDGIMVGGAGAGGVGSAAMPAGYTASTVANAGIGPAGAAGGLKGVMGSVGGAISKYGPLGLGAYGTIDAGKRMDRAEAQRDKAIAAANARYAERDPVRQAAIDMALNSGPGSQSRPDLSAMFASQNPYYRPAPR